MSAFEIYEELLKIEDRAKEQAKILSTDGKEKNWKDYIDVPEYNIVRLTYSNINLSENLERMLNTLERLNHTIACIKPE